MGRKAKGKSTAAAVELDSEVASTVESKQKAGDDALEAKKYGDALAAYDEALKALPERHGLVAGLHASKANVYLSDRKYKEAIKECNQGLAIEGNNEKVLKCRAHARYESGMFKDALNDIQKATSSGEKTTEEADFEQKVRSALSGKTSANGAADGANGVVAEGGAANGSAVAKKKESYTREQTASMLKQSPSMFVCKATLEQETKYVHVPFGIGYHQLQQIIKSRWTGLHNFKIYYHDRDADWVLITNSKDVQRAQQEILQYAQRMVNQRQRQGLDSQPPTCRFKLEKCHKADVPPVPKDERPRGEETSKVVVKSADPHAEETVIELDDWLIEFANLFREHLGIDPDKHVDMQTEGTERCTRALDSVVQLPEAQGLFGEAFDRFRDVTCVGLCNWANVHLCLAKKLLEAAATDEGGYEGVQSEFERHCGESARRYNEALGYNEACVEALLGIGQVRIEEARAAAGVLIPPLDGVDSEAYKTLNAEEVDEVNRQQGRDANVKLKAALEKVTGDAVKASTNVWDQVYEAFEKARIAADSTAKKDETQAREDARAHLTVSPPAEDQMHLLTNQVQIMWGNALYDQSQIWAGVGLDGWKDMLDDAKKRFLSATCKESDVNEALRNHIQAEDLDLPPEEDGAAGENGAANGGAAASGSGAGAPAAEDAQKEGPAQKQGAKGLPALKKKKGGK